MAGVISLQIFSEQNAVIVEGSEEMDPLKLIERLQKKTGKKPALISVVPRKDHYCSGDNRMKSQHEVLVEANDKFPKINVWLNLYANQIFVVNNSAGTADPEDRSALRQMLRQGHQTDHQNRR